MRKVRVWPMAVCFLTAILLARPLTAADKPIKPTNRRATPPVAVAAPKPEKPAPKDMVLPERDEFVPPDAATPAVRVMGSFADATGAWLCGDLLMSQAPREFVSGAGRSYGLLFSVHKLGSFSNEQRKFLSPDKVEALLKLSAYLKSADPAVTKAPYYEISGSVDELKLTIFGKQKEEKRTLSVDFGTISGQCNADSLASLDTSVEASIEALNLLR